MWPLAYIERKTVNKRGEVVFFAHMSEIIGVLEKCHTDPLLNLTCRVVGTKVEIDADLALNE